MDIRRVLYDNHWTLGFPQNSISDIINGGVLNIKWMKNPFKDRWYADPFILGYDDENIYILAEEFYDPIGRGRISKLTIDRKKYQLKNVDVVLELPTHLSFPAIIRKDGDVYIYPENGASGELILYKYNPLNNDCKPIKNLADGYLADAIQTDLFGEPLLFATIVPKQNLNELVVFVQSEGKYYQYKKIFFEENVARNAGDWFMYEGSIYRPAQDCTNAYGGEMILQKVSYLNSTFKFENIRRIKESFGTYKLGCHTFNHFDGISVIDVNGYRRPLLASAGKMIVKLRHRI